VRLELQQDLPLIEADTGQLQQVIMNLVINGAEAVGENAGRVIVTTGAQEVDEAYSQTIWSRSELPLGRYVVLEVSDNGCGMDEETLHKIFDPFFTTKFAGRGLGLAAVLGIVRGHKGAFKIYSAPGQGTTFKLFFPAASAMPMPQPRRTIDAELAGSGQMVLVVDDEEIVRKAASYCLNRYGYRVVVATSGHEAIDIFRQSHGEIALVLLDLTMPEMSGEAVLGELQKIQPAVRVLLSSGFNEVEAVRRFTGKGLAGFVQKPYTSATLGAKVKQILDSAARQPD